VDDARWKEIQAERWDGAAARWRALGLPDRDTLKQLIADLGCAPGALLLDIGCGAGLWSIALAQAGYRVRGVDVLPQMIREEWQLAQEHYLGPDIVNFNVGSAEEVNAVEGTFNGIISRAVLDFVPSPGAALAEFWRVLEPEGRLLLSVLGAHSPAKRELWRRFLPEAPALLAMYYILPWEAEALLRELDWEIVDGRPNFGPAATGATKEYSPEIAEQLGDRIVLQAIATAWEVVAVKPAHSTGDDRSVCNSIDADA
jgi:2-polyprenyl-3-methyl-5-hydroxy-6-metoxy-1,4-benzoquinol methylase